MVMLLRAHLRADQLRRHSLQCSVTEHYCTRHPRINKKASAASLCVACTINTQHGTSTSLSRVMSGNAVLELGSLAMEMVSFQHNFVFLFPEHLKALQKQHRGGNTSCKQQLLNTRKALFPLSLFTILSKNLSSTEGICEQQSCNNHLPSSTDYIQAFFFLKCSFPIPIHSFSKCMWSFLCS